MICDFIQIIIKTVSVATDTVLIITILNNNPWIII